MVTCRAWVLQKIGEIRRLLKLEVEADLDFTEEETFTAIRVQRFGWRGTKSEDRHSLVAPSVDLLNGSFRIFWRYVLGAITHEAIAFGVGVIDERKVSIGPISRYIIKHTLEVLAGESETDGCRRVQILEDHCEDFVTQCRKPGTPASTAVCAIGGFGLLAFVTSSSGHLEGTE